MPKKPPKNAFYYFMQDFKEEQQKQGINYGSLADVSKAADPEWRKAPPSVRIRYEAKAKKEKEKHNIPLEKFTSTGVALSVLEEQEKEAREAIDRENNDIIGIVKKKKMDKKISDDYFYLMDINYYCKAPNGYMIGEVTVLRFSLNNGIKDRFHRIVNPGKIPIGYASDVKHGSVELGLEMPDETEKITSYMEILAMITDYLKQDPCPKGLPPVYTMPDKVIPIKDFFLQMCDMSGEREFIFKVYRLDKLFFHLINTIKIRSNEGFPRESLALIELQKDPFKYNVGLGCVHHESGEKAVQCTTSRTKRWAYTILDYCCPVMGIPMRANDHLPADYDVDAIIKYKESQNAWGGPTVAGYRGPSSSCNSTGNESLVDQNLNSTATSLSEQTQKEKKTHIPLRMPLTDYSKEIRPAPELNDQDFPALRGRGRGSGKLSGSFGKMNIRK